MKRKIYDELLKWKRDSSDKYALIIDGARRVGKSYIVEEFAKKEYDSYIIIDFSARDQSVIDMFNLYLPNLDQFFSVLSKYFSVKLVDKRSLIIFDEVQIFPRAREAIKRLVADGRYHYIETGSLLSIKTNVQDIVIPSEELHINMYPMDFEEFLWATDNSEMLSVIKKHFETGLPMGQSGHRLAMNLFRQYLVVGGMPQAVKEYIDNGDFKEVEIAKQAILALYRNDISKFAGLAVAKTRSVFDDIPSQLMKHNKTFSPSSLKKGARTRDYSDALLWLDDAGVIAPCFNSTEPSIGLRMSSQRPSMKAYMADTGLLISLAFDENGIAREETYKSLLTGKLEVNEGMLIENIVAQILRAKGHKLYFYSNGSKSDVLSRMEIDFLIAKSKTTNRHNISPIEVKSSKNYTLSSLRKFKQKYKEQLATPYVIHTSDYKVEDDIVFLPIYMAMCL